MQEDIAKAIETLRKGGLILYPTDTVWGIGCDATNAEAVKRIFALKQRSDSKALITLVGSTDYLWDVVDNVPEPALQLAELSERPVTIVYDHGRGVASELLATDGSIGVRVTSEPFSRELCLRFRRPIVSTSANISGTPTPRCFREIRKEIIDGVDYVCTTRRKEGPQASPSMVIKIADNGVFSILRK